MSRFGTGMAERVLRRLGLEPWPDSGNSPALVDELNRMRAENDELRRIATTERSEYDECEAELMTTAKRADQLEAEVARLREELERLRADVQWVSVEERLPEERYCVPVVVRTGDGDYVTTVAYHVFGDWRTEGDMALDWDGDEVTHWMPAPALPEEASGE